ncbi:hypothetical protein FACS1894132_03850 [Clostridia bacterium]|nr:hypothetical protein FACS1894132_03850 [Clostridia bacterium]
MSNKINNNSKNFFSAGVAIALALLILAVVIPLNLIAGRLDIKWDMTPKGIFELSQKTKSILSGLDKDVYIYPLFELNDARDEKDNARQFYPYYSIYKSFDKYDHVVVKSADPETDTGLKILNDLNIPQELYWDKGDALVVCGNIIKRVYAGAQFVYDEANGVIEMNTENDLASAVAYVSKGINPIVYYLMGHGEKTIDNYSALSANMTTSGYTLTALDLSAGAAVPTDAEVLLLVAPQTDVTDLEYAQIMEFIQNGGNIEIFLPPNSSEETYSNIAKIMENFGMYMNFDTVTDESNTAPDNENIFLASLIAYTPASYAPNGTVDYEGDEANLTGNVISIANNSSYPIATYMPLSRSFFTNIGTKNVKVGQLLTTYSTDGYTYSAIGTPTGGTYKDDDVIGGSEMTLAAYAVNKDQEDAALVVYGADFLNNDCTASEYFINPLNLFLVSITWIHETDINLAISPKIISYDSMTFADETQANKMIVILALIPAVMVVFAVIVWFRRGRVSSN